MRRHFLILTALVAAVCLFGAASVPAADYPFSTWSEQFSRWKSRPLQGAYDRMVSGGPDGSTLITFPYLADPIRSFDGGVTWESFSIEGQRPLEVSIAPRNSRLWYAWAGRTLYRTTDGGQTWSPLGEPLPVGSNGYSIQVSADPNVVYRTIFEFLDPCDFNECPATYGTLQVSKDAGITWHAIGSPQNFQLAYPSPVDSNLVFALGKNGLQRSFDQGATWTPIAVPYGSTPEALAWGQLTLDRFDPAIAYFEPSRTELSIPVFSTRDGGATWTSATLSGGRMFADGAQRGRAYVFTYFFGAYETRDAGLTWVKVDPTVYTSINSNIAAVVLRAGKRFAVGPYFNTVRELDLNNGALALASDLWWNPDESGWGMTITHRASTQTFVAWYTYDRAGDAIWRIIPGGTWSDRTYSGDVYETTGSAYFGARFEPAAVNVRKVGTAQINFDSENQALFSYQLASGDSGSKRIERQRFGPAVPWPVVEESYADLWWNATESGWGIAINHQHDNIFATWFAYDVWGRPLWVVMPYSKVVVRDGVPTAAGDIYVTRGPPSSLPFDPSQVVLTKIGTASLAFGSKGDAVLSSTAFGLTESRVITRQPF
jgi:photosystem II stability/assembly factor-like uncharacterized protein